MIILYDCISIVPHITPNHLDGRLGTEYVDCGDGEDLSVNCRCYGYGNGNGSGGVASSGVFYSGDIEQHSIDSDSPTNFARG